MYVYNKNQCAILRIYIRGDPKIFYLLTGCSLLSSTTKKIFLAFEGHKGRKAKKGQNFQKISMAQNA